jgi:hypothetical protein
LIRGLEGGVGVPSGQDSQGCVNREGKMVVGRRLYNGIGNDKCEALHMLWEIFGTLSYGWVGEGGPQMSLGITIMLQFCVLEFGEDDFGTAMQYK